MLEATNDEKLLLTRVRDKRKELADYLAKSEPRNSRLINSSIIAGALAASLTAGPGIGGEGFISSVKDIVSFGVPVWQLLCLLSTVLSVAVVIVNGIMKSNSLTSKIATTRVCDTKLEGLEPCSN